MAATVTGGFLLQCPRPPPRSHRSPITALGLRPGLGPSLLPADRYSYSYSYGRCEKTIHALRFSQSSQLHLLHASHEGLVRVYGDGRR